MVFSPFCDLWMQTFDVDPNWRNLPALPTGGWWSTYWSMRLSDWKITWSSEAGRSLTVRDTTDRVSSPQWSLAAFVNRWTHAQQLPHPLRWMSLSTTPGHGIQRMLIERMTQQANECDHSVAISSFFIFPAQKTTDISHF